MRYRSPSQSLQTILMVREFRSGCCWENMNSRLRWRPPEKLNQKMPDDVMLYGFLTDANVELGNYKEAETAAQWMLDLKAGNMPGLTRAAYLRELFGDIDGSMDLMNMAYQSTPPSEVEDAAWIVTQMAHLDLAIGKIEEAEKLSQQALTMFPGYHYALGNLAKVRIQQKRYDEAVELLRQRYQAAPHAENLFDLARALQIGRDARKKRRKPLLNSNRNRCWKRTGQTIPITNWSSTMLTTRTSPPRL